MKKYEGKALSWPILAAAAVLAVLMLALLALSLRGGGAGEGPALDASPAPPAGDQEEQPPHLRERHEGIPTHAEPPPEFRLDDPAPPPRIGTEGFQGQPQKRDWGLPPGSEPRINRNAG